jgi:hypothetical protein
VRVFGLLQYKKRHAGSPINGARQSSGEELRLQSGGLKNSMKSGDNKSCPMM